MPRAGYARGMRTNEITEDLRAIREDWRDVKDNADRKLQNAEEEHPSLRWALDLRVVLTAAAVALLVSLVVHLAGAGFIPTLLLFLVLFAGVWAGITRAATPRRPTRAV
jgi:hypothetical protein